MNAVELRSLQFLRNGFAEDPARGTRAHLDLVDTSASVLGHVAPLELHATSTHGQVLMNPKALQDYNHQGSTFIRTK